MVYLFITIPAPWAIGKLAPWAAATVVMITSRTQWGQITGLALIRTAAAVDHLRTECKVKAELCTCRRHC